MKYNTIIKTGFFPIDEDKIYFRLFQRCRTRSSYFKIKGMIDYKATEIVIYSGVDDTFLILKAGPPVFFKLGSKLKRGMTTKDIVDEGIKRGIIQSRMDYRLIKFADIDIAEEKGKQYNYLVNI